MSVIEYNYTVEAVLERTVVLLYSHPTFGQMEVHARRPKVGETIDQIAEEYSPAAWWREQSAEFAPITPGVQGSGAVTFPEPLPPLTEGEALALWRNTVAISQLQAHHTLRTWGLYEQVQGLVAVVGAPLDLAFDRAIEWRRNSPTITSLFTNLTMPDGSNPTPEVVDAFFREALEFEL